MAKLDLTRHACPLCGMGRLRPTRTPYVHVYEGTLVQVPGVAGWKCDMCGLTVFDERTLRRIEVLIDADGLPPNHYVPGPGIPSVRDGRSPADELPEDAPPPTDA